VNGVERRGTAAFVVQGLGVELPAVALALALASVLWPGRAAWAAGGAAAMAALGLAFGAWLVALHGRPSSEFLVALVAGMFARAVAALAGSAVALVAGGQAAAWAFISGLAAGWVPLQVFETVWFMRRAAPEVG
jgi:hypothetical protein